MVKRLNKGRSAPEIRKGVTSFMTAAKSKNFDVKLVRSDGEGGVESMRNEINAAGAELDVTGAQGHVDIAERATRTVKERVRIHENLLPYVMTMLLLTYCVYFCVSCLNMEPSSKSALRLSPREQFVGRKVDALIDYRFEFGEYVQASVPTTDNTMKSRTEGCVALVSTGNLKGSVVMLKLATGRVVTREHFVQLPMPDLVIQLINTTAEKEGMRRGVENPALGVDQMDSRADDELVPAQQQQQQPGHIRLAEQGGDDYNPNADEQPEHQEPLIMAADQPPQEPTATDDANTSGEDRTDAADDSAGGGFDIGDDNAGSDREESAASPIPLVSRGVRHKLVTRCSGFSIARE